MRSSPTASADAYERVVDRLLASPRYGERMATDWLDLARYADTHGYQIDGTRDMWPWRDWVITAFNDNLPFDDFITGQLAGDLLPTRRATSASRPASTATTAERARAASSRRSTAIEYVVDRVNTLGTAFLGLTLECARCHDHKYDPITQRDFYGLFAFFNNVNEAARFRWACRVDGDRDEHEGGCQAGRAGGADHDTRGRAQAGRGARYYARRAPPRPRPTRRARPWRSRPASSPSSCSTRRVR